MLIWIFTLFIFVFPILKSSINLSYFSGYIGYFILGFYLSESQNRILNDTKFSLLLILIGATATIFGNYFIKGGSFEDYLTPNMMLLSVGIFLLFKNIDMSKNFLHNQIVLKISKYSFAIYLIHVLFISILNKIFNVNCFLISPYLGVFAVSIIVLFCSFVFLEIFKRLPYTKYISGI